MLPQVKELVKDPQICSCGFGLFAKTLQAPLPLTKVDIKASIHESIAKVTFSQTYQNPTDSLLETEYLFPIPPNARFDAFQARYENITINGVIKEKETAQKEYQTNLQKGNTVAYAEVLKEAPDVMKVQAGNIKPFTEIQITFSYIQKLTIVRNRFYKFVFYSTLGPRYHSNSGPSTKNTVTLSQYPVLKPKEGYIWNIEVDVKCKSPITYLECTSHKTTKVLDDANVLEGRLTLPPTDDSQAVFNKNFEVLLSYESVNAPAHRLAKNETGYCAMIDFLPRYDDDSLDDAVKAATQQSTSNPDDVNMLTATGEYIFLIDRSGSMDGQRIKMAKDALIMALKSLPPSSYFNIYSFGSSYSALTTNSTPSDEKNINNAIEQVKRFDADMGGTEIYYAIQTILNQPRKKNHPRTLFLLTDGEVSNPDSVIKLIETNNHRARVFSLGIGSGCSTYLVGGCATAGRGKSEFVSDLNSISDKVISLMEAAFTPVCDDFTFEFTDKEAVSMIAPDPQSLSYMLRDEKATFYVFLKNEAIKSANENGEFIVTLKNFDTALGGYRTSPIKLNLKEYETSLDIFKLGIGEAADILEKKDRNVSVKDNPDIYWAMKESINDELVKMSVDNQVLTRRTAFVAVVKENSGDEIGGLTKEKILIPQVLSSDYAEKPKPQYIPEPNPLHYYSRSAATTTSLSKGMPMPQPQVNSISDESDGECDDECDEFGEDLGFEKECLNEEECDELKCDNMLSLDEAMPISFKSSTPIFKSPSTKADKCKEEESKSTSLQTKDSKKRKSNAISTESKKESIQNPTVSTSETNLTGCLQSQKPLGNWEVSTQLLGYLGISKDDLLAKAPESVKNAKGADLEQVAITLLLLIWIEKYFQAKKGTWNLIHKKGVQWLKSVGVKYADVISEVNFL